MRQVIAHSWSELVNAPLQHGITSPARSFSRLTTSLLWLPPSVLLMMTAIACATATPEDVRRWASLVMTTFLPSLFFSFAGVASASGTLRAHPATRMPGHCLLILYGLTPFLVLAALIVGALLATTASS